MRGIAVLFVALMACSREPTHVTTSRACAAIGADSGTNELAFALVSGATACGASDFVVAPLAARDGVRALAPASPMFGVEPADVDDLLVRRETRVFDGSNPDALRTSVGRFLGVSSLSERHIPTSTTRVAASTFDLSARLLEPLPQREKGRFRHADGTWSTTDMVGGRVRALYGQSEGDRLLDLSFEAPGVAILFVIPGDSRPIDRARHQRWLEALRPIEIDVQLPMFQLATTFDAAPLLAPTTIAHVVALQSVRVAFDGRGINAKSAATPPSHRWNPSFDWTSFVADRPFFFFVHDTHQSSDFAIIAAGHVEHPSEP